MLEFEKPDMEIVRFGKDVIATSIACDCDLGEGPEGDDEYCTHGIGADGDLSCIITEEQGNC